jgi:hypothetical protein
MKHLDLQTDYRNFVFHQGNILASSFFNEMDAIIQEIQEILGEIKLLRYKEPKDYLPNDLAIKNIKLTNLNLNFFLALLNNFKLDPLNKAHKKLIKLNLIRLYLFIVQEFKNLRNCDPEFFYFSIDEENRYIYNIRHFFNSKAKLLKPGNQSYLYIRHIKYYIYKVKKHFTKQTEEMHMWKCGYYVIF